MFVRSSQPRCGKWTQRSVDKRKRPRHAKTCFHERTSSDSDCSFMYSRHGSLRACLHLGGGSKVSEVSALQGIIEPQSRDTCIRHFHKRCATFLPSLCTISTVKTRCRVRVWSKAGKLAKKETIKHPTKSTKKLHSFRQKRNKSCLCFVTSVIKSFNINFKVRSQKLVIFFVLLLRINF